jgi:hypothetical protein
MKKQMIALGSALMLSSVSGLAQQSPIGADGADGVDGVDGGSGGEGGHGGTGEDYLSILGADDAVWSVRAKGGDGGDGGKGSLTPAGAGGDGGLGGNAFSSIEILRMAGPLSVSASSTGGDGGNYGDSVDGTLSGVSGYGGDGIVNSVSAQTADASDVEVTVNAMGGKGGLSTRPSIIGSSGGGARVGPVYAASAGGDIAMVIEARSGNGGTGFRNRIYEVTGWAGAGGATQDVELIDIVDADTSGSIDITQLALTGQVGFAPYKLGRAGNAVSEVNLEKAAVALSIRTEATAGNGGGTSWGYGSGDGGGARSSSRATNTVGEATAVSNATGGHAGEIFLEDIDIGDPEYNGHGGDAAAVAEAEGASPTAYAVALGGGAGGAPPTGLTDAVLEGGIGGDATAEAAARSIDATFVDVRAEAQGGRQGASGDGHPASGSRSGNGVATAAAVGDGGAALALATGFSASAQSFFAHRSTNTLSGNSSANATAINSIVTEAGFTVVETIRVENGAASVFGEANVASSASIDRADPISDDRILLGAAVSAGVPGRLFDLNYSFRNTANMTGVAPFTSVVEIQRYVSGSAPVTLEFNTAPPAGDVIRSMTFEFLVEGQPLIPLQTFNSTAAAEAFFNAAPYAFGNQNSGLDDLLSIEIRMSVQLNPPAIPGVFDGFDLSTRISGPSWSSGPPLVNAIRVDPDIIDEVDRSVLVSIEPDGEGVRAIYDGRTDAVSDVNVHLFTAAYDNGQAIEVRVHPEFDAGQALILAESYARVLGRLPVVLRDGVSTMTIHDGIAPLRGQDDDLLVPVGQAAIDQRQGFLEESFVREAVRVSLDAVHAQAEEWLAAQESDGRFVTELAETFPASEDLAESFLLYLAALYRPDRISERTRDTIVEAIPARIDYLERQNFDFYPITSAPETRILGFTRNLANSGFILRWTSIPGLSYGVDQSTDLLNWDSIAEMLGEPSGENAFEVLDAEPVVEAGFYRVRQLEPDE